MRPRYTRHQAALAAKACQKKRQVTITNLVANVRAKTGRTPTPDEIAGLLASTPARVRYHLSQIKKGITP
jgi:hypothetical protein